MAGPAAGWGCELLIGVEQSSSLIRAWRTPALALVTARITKARLQTLLRRAGRQRNLETCADRLHAHRRPALQRPSQYLQQDTGMRFPPFSGHLWDVP